MVWPWAASEACISWRTLDSSAAERRLADHTAAASSTAITTTPAATQHLLTFADRLGTYADRAYNLVRQANAYGSNQIQARADIPTPQQLTNSENNVRTLTFANAASGGKHAVALANAIKVNNKRNEQAVTAYPPYHSRTDAATAGDDWMRPALCEEALRIGRILAELAPGEAEVHGLVALMEIQASRLRARVGPHGEPVLLADQDRARWDHLLVQRGLAGLRRAEELSGALGPYTLQAAIAACHARCRSVEETDWQRIVALYDGLAALTGSPVVELNRAVAVTMAFGPACKRHGFGVVPAARRRGLNSPSSSSSDSGPARSGRQTVKPCAAARSRNHKAPRTTSMSPMSWNNSATGRSTPENTSERRRSAISPGVVRKPLKKRTTRAKNRRSAER